MTAFVVAADPPVSVNARATVDCLRTSMPRATFVVLLAAMTDGNASVWAAYVNCCALAENARARKQQNVI